MKKTLPLGLLALVAVVALAGWKGGCGRPNHGDPAQMTAFVNDRFAGLMDDLEATPAQRTQLAAIKDRMLQRFQGLQATRKATHETLLAEWKAEKADRSKIHALIDERADEMRTLAHEAADAAIEAHDVLTPEQRTILAAKVQAMHGHH